MILDQRRYAQTVVDCFNAKNTRTDIIPASSGIAPLSTADGRQIGAEKSELRETQSYLKGMGALISIATTVVRLELSFVVHGPAKVIGNRGPEHWKVVTKKALQRSNRRSGFKQGGIVRLHA